MDRREALKKLGAGSAIAATGSIVLSSRAVASSGSGTGPGGLTGIPGPGEQLPITVQTSLSSNGKRGTVTISDSTSPMCGLNGANSWYSWRIVSSNIKGGNGWKLQIKDGSDSQVIRGFDGGSFTTSDPNHGTVLLRKANNGGAPKPLDRGDVYEVEMLVTWQCQGADDVERVYRFSSSFPDSPQGLPAT
jgi:hypothetical protein